MGLHSISEVKKTNCSNTYNLLLKLHKVEKFLDRMMIRDKKLVFHDNPKYKILFPTQTLISTPKLHLHPKNYFGLGGTFMV